MGMEFIVTPDVLIPRQDTETLVEAAIERLRGKKSPRIADICTGSGAIALALEKFAKADVTAIELSGKAFYFLEKNIADNNSTVNAKKADVLTCCGDFADGSLDLIVSNPPYIPHRELAGLQAEVRFEPEMALDGGADGLDFYRAIVRCWSKKLKPGGAMVFELGEEQAGEVAAMMKAQGFSGIRTEQDFGGCERAIIGQRDAFH